MNAWMQRLMVASIAAGAALAWWLGGRLGLAWPWRALLVAAVVVPQAFGVALQYAMLRRWGRDDEPPASLAALARAWSHEVMHGWRVFGWRQPFREHAQPDVPATPGRTPVLLLHGFFCNRAFWAPWLARLASLSVGARAITLEPAYGDIDAMAERVDEALRALEAASGRRPVIVAHSMGGLAARAWLARFAGDARVARIVTIGTPHRGTWLARFGATANARQMRRDSAWLQRLAAGEPPGRAARFVCFYSNADNIVFPPRTATLEGADNRLVAGVAHVQMAFEPAVFDAVREIVAAADAENGAGASDGAGAEATPSAGSSVPGAPIDASPSATG